MGRKETADVFENLGLRSGGPRKVIPSRSPEGRHSGASTRCKTQRPGLSSKSLVLGRSYVKMGGFANMTTAEIQELTDSVAESAVVMTSEGVTSVDNFDASWRNIRDGIRQGSDPNRQLPHTAALPILRQDEGDCGRYQAGRSS